MHKKIIRLLLAAVLIALLLATITPVSATPTTRQSPLPTPTAVHCPNCVHAVTTPFVSPLLMTSSITRQPVTSHPRGTHKDSITPAELLYWTWLIFRK